MANEIRSELGDSINIIPTIFTLLNENNIEDEIKKLNEEGITVVGKQGLEKLLNDVRLGTDLQDVIRSTFSRISSGAVISSY
ncbi:unnamed protein product [marine sediment metagenome]|uniref:Uncharacterized protein n=1 Tax=marine sediment metagenome TaxID=412755 RepID=X1LJK2_9ZZZZ